MAKFKDDTMKRLDRLEAAVVHMTDVLVLQSERMDAGFRLLSEHIDVVAQRVDVLAQRVDVLAQHVDGVTERLDRLIAVTTEERTLGFERLAKIESRLARLEEHVGL